MPPVGGMARIGERIDRRTPAVIYEESCERTKQRNQDRRGRAAAIPSKDGPDRRIFSGSTRDLPTATPHQDSPRRTR